jgi:ABC-type uncharacterized transport system permease subunit
MLSGVQIICFATSYAVALALELSRLLFRSGVRGVVMLLFAGIGLVIHSAFLYHQAFRKAGSPLSSERDWYLVAAWVLVVVYLYLVYYHPQNAFGLFLLPLVLGLICAGALADDTSFDQDRAAGIWGVIHGTSILLATVAVLFASAAGVMYLTQARRLKHKLPPIRGLRLPSLEWLRRANSRTIAVSVPMLGVGVFSGIILSLVRTAKLSWRDPLVASTSAMFAWLLVAVVIGALYRPAREGRKVAYLTIVSFLFLLIALALFLSTQHGGSTEGGGVNAEGGPARHATEDLGPGGEGAGGRAQGSGLVIRSPSPIIPHPWFLTPDSCPLTPDSCPLTPDSSLLTLRLLSRGGPA